MVSNVSFERPRVLVVDDDAHLSLLLSSFLEEKGFDVVSAGGVADAKHILQLHDSLDLMLLDYQLNDGVGMDLLTSDVVAAYRKPLPVIMISANESPDFLAECFAGGVNDYIIKPVNLSLLALKVDALIKTIKMQQVIEQQNTELEQFKRDVEREEQIAKSTYKYLLGQYSTLYDGIDVWLKSFAAFSGDITLAKKSPNGSLYFMLADATGHGLSAAITIMPVLAIFNSMVRKGFHVQQIVAELNRELVSNTPVERFVAASVFEINPSKGKINIWNGGMPSVYWVDKGSVVHECKSRHMALGILECDMFDASIETIDLPSEGFLFTYTDGLSEQENENEVPFSTSKVLEVIAQQPKDLLSALATELKIHVGVEEYDDDVSMCFIDPKRVFSM